MRRVPSAGRGSPLKAIGRALALLGAAGLLVSTGCGDDSTTTTAAQTKVDTSKPPVRVALIAIKIPAVDILTGFQVGVDAAVQQINAKDGFGGRRLVVDSCNSMLQTAVTATCARKTIAKDPVAAITCDLTWDVAGMPIYKQAGVSSWGCKNTPGDYSDPSSFGISVGTFGEQRGFAHYLCTRSDVRRVVIFLPDLPDQREIGPAAGGQALKNCGKAVAHVYAPVGGPDFAPHVNKAMQFRPDFVMTQHGGAAAVQIYKLFKQAGLPPSRMAAASNVFDYENLEQGGAALEGTYSAFETANWSDTRDPGVAAYRKAVQATGEDPRLATSQFGYATIMFFYDVARRVGFDKFDASTLQTFMNSPASKGIPVPLGKTIAHPGPKDYRAVRHPWVQIVQMKNGNLDVVTKGTDGGGWIYAY